MANYEGNLFPGKYVNFKVGPDFTGSFQEFLTEAVELLLKFGEHVLVLSWEIDDSECHLEMCKAILKGLSHAPNVQSLKIWGSLDGRRINAEPNLTNSNEYFSKAESLDLFPKLKYLESLQWELFMDSGSCKWMDQMINYYGGGCGKGNGLRKLSLENNRWNAGKAVNLKNLAEMHLIFFKEWIYKIEDVEDVLGLFPNGQLKKLLLIASPLAQDYWTIYIDELIGMLGKFQIENVVLEQLNLKEKSGRLSGTEITSLHLEDCGGLTYEFLKRLPNL